MLYNKLCAGLLRLLVLLIVCCLQACNSSRTETAVGTGQAGNSGDGGPATQAKLNNPEGTALDNAGNLYFADTNNSEVRKVDNATKVITKVAGTGTPGFSGDGGPAVKAQLDSPEDVAVAAASKNVYIADTKNSTVRKVTKAGIISSVAGRGEAGFNGDGIPATDALLSFPEGVAVDSAENLYIADTGNQRIRRVNNKTGIIRTIAGTGVAGYSGDGGPAIAAQINSPSGLFVDNQNNVYFADTGNNVIRRIDTAGIITTVAGTGTAGYSGDGGPATAAQLNSPRDVFVDPIADFAIADTDNNVIRGVVGSTGTIFTIAGTGTAGYSGDGGPATAAQFNHPSSIVSDNASILYIADTNNNVIRSVTISASPTVTSVTPNTGSTLGGTTVTISGFGFFEVSAVRFGNTPAASFTVNSDTSITAVSPPGAAGTVDVTVTTVFGTSPISPPDQFTYVAPIFVFPPEHVRGRQLENKFATQTDIVNIVTWLAPSSGTTPVAYKIYRNAGLTELIKTVKADNHHKFRFEDHNRREHKTYTYFIVSIDAAGHQSVAASVTVKGH